MSMAFWKTKRPVRLHVGSGRERLEGWVNIDLQPLPGVDVVADVTRGLRFTDVEAVFAEHFLEHLGVDQALAFLAEVHRSLRPDGRLRLSTPNLDWVWLTHYRLEAEAAAKRTMALRLNRAFHGWQHRFLWNREMLEEALLGVGFADLDWCRYGESRHALFQGIERHETYGDSAELPHVLIVEAGKGTPDGERLAALRRLIQGEFLDHLAG